MRRIAATELVILALILWPAALPAQPVKRIVATDQPDARRTKDEFTNLLDHYPPTVKAVFKQDPSLLTLDAYLATYPALASFLGSHPEIVRNPAYYLNGLGGNQDQYDAQAARSRQMMSIWSDLVGFAAFGMGAGLFVWLLRIFVDYRRWNRLSRVQAEVHTKLMDRLGTNEELLAYMATPAGSKFLQSAPISLDSGPASRSMSAPLGRIMWSVQAGLVLVAAGIGLMFASERVDRDFSLPLQVMGIVAAALGVGFAVSAGVSYLLSQKMGLLDPALPPREGEPPERQH